MRHPGAVLGLGDGGAHCGTICDGSYPTFMLTHWVRDRTRGERLPLASIVQWLACDTARAVGLLDRGIIAPGYKANLNVIDLDRLLLHAPEVAYDLPAAGGASCSARKVMQRRSSTARQSIAMANPPARCRAASCAALRRTNRGDRGLLLSCYELGYPRFGALLRQQETCQVGWSYWPFLKCNSSVTCLSTTLNIRAQHETT